MCVCVSVCLFVLLLFFCDCSSCSSSFWVIVKYVHPVSFAHLQPTTPCRMANITTLFEDVDRAFHFLHSLSFYFAFFGLRKQLATSLQNAVAFCCCCTVNQLCFLKGFCCCRSCVVQKVVKYLYFISCCCFLLALFVVVIVELLGSCCCWALVLLLLHKKSVYCRQK